MRAGQRNYWILWQLNTYFSKNKSQFYISMFIITTKYTIPLKFKKKKKITGFKTQCCKMSRRNRVMTKMHSSRMRTVRSSGRIWGGCVCSGGGVCLLPAGECLLWGCLLRGGVWSQRGVCSWGAVWSQGVSGPRGVWYPSMHWGRHPHPPCGQTDACKNITFATLLRMVIMNQSTDSKPLLLILMFYVICKTTKRIRARMHSSRMRTTRLLTISQHALPGGIPAQGGVPAWEVYLFGRCTCPGGGVPA